MKKFENDELSIITNIFIIAASIVIYNTKKNYKLYKEFNNKNKLTIQSPEVIKSSLNKDDNMRIKNLELGKEILHFKKVLATNFNSKYLNILYNNLKTLKADEHIILFRNLLLNPVAGFYRPKKNQIKILKFFKQEVINHELLHMATTVYDKKNNKAYAGFCQIDYKNGEIIGKAINEGYTELLTARYFNPNNYATKPYKISKLLASLLELIVGQEKMEKLYLSADLNGLITELEKFDTKENIIKFIHSWDYYFKYSNNKDSILLLPSIKENINNSLVFVKTKLIEWFKIKEHDNKKIKQFSNIVFHDSLLKTYKKEYY